MTRRNLLRALSKAHYGRIRLETILAEWREQLLAGGVDLRRLVQ